MQSNILLIPPINGILNFVTFSPITEVVYRLICMLRTFANEVCILHFSYNWELYFKACVCNHFGGVTSVGLIRIVKFVLFALVS